MYRLFFLVKISSDVLDPFAGRLSSFLADSLLGSSSLLAELFLSGLTSLLVGLSSLLSDLSTSGDKSVVGLVVGQGVGDLESVENSVFLGGSDGALDLVGVDDSANVGVGLVPSAVQGHCIKPLEGQKTSSKGA